MASPPEWLKYTQAYLQEAIGPHAALLDQDARALRAALRGLGDRGLLGLRIPAEWGGPGVDELTFRRFQEQVAQYSGALAFLQTQHQSAANMLVKSPNVRLQQSYLPYLSQGQRLLGIGFSQLRHQQKPLVTVTAAKGGYRINGEVPWVTGYGCFQEFIIGASLPDGRALFGLVPLENAVQKDGGTITLSRPLHLAAMASTNTVKAGLNDWWIPKSYIVAIQPSDWIVERDRRNVLQHSFFALGCARAGLNVLEAHQNRSIPSIASAWETLDQELNTCRDKIYRAEEAPETEDFEHRLQLRAWSIELAVRCAHAAIAVSRGAANYSHHPAQRIYREALAFTVFGQTTAVMEATLARLTE